LLRRAQVCASAAATLQQKLRTLRRLRLPLLYDDFCWTAPQGALNHLLITVPFWLRCVSHTHLLANSPSSPSRVRHIGGGCDEERRRRAPSSKIFTSK